MNNNRRLQSLIRALGGDPLSFNWDLASSVQPVYVLDDLRHGLGVRHNGKIIMGFVPSTLAANFSGFELHCLPSCGIWIKRLFIQGGNVIWNINASIPFPLIGASDASPFSWIPPEAVQNAQSETGSSPGTFLVNGSPGVIPPIFAGFNVGHQTVAPAAGNLWVSNATQPMLEDLWLPPGVFMNVFCNVANTAITIWLEMDIPPEIATVTP